MMTRKYSGMSLWLILVLWLITELVAACSSTPGTAGQLPPIQTQLLVRAPDGPLPVNKSISVRSLTEAADGVSHVELYAVQLPTGHTNVIIRSDPATTVNQPSFTVAQTFTPTQPGHFVIKVVGYNSFGQSDESDYISFDVQ
jgi:hypothetical protein